ncbi:conserved hypothetical protein [uncultured Defluviicoccus sp.]|uniref:TPM domain-containing protein n=1 Tax=metagenome TaxID=256318 RepID=A0A380T7H7_9ZZZZ|nr:conserved hypothetical protein [uncultured Defluviicoccus sp.]
MVKLLLSERDRQEIEVAVRVAEARSSGQIICVIDEEASDYREISLLWAAGISLAAPLVPLTIGAIVLGVRDAFQGWSEFNGPSISPIFLLAAYATLQVAAFLLVALVVGIPAVRRALTPRSIKQRFVKGRAIEMFELKQVAKTSERTGLLLYLSLKDRCAELVVDRALDAKVPSGEWQRIVRTLIHNIRRGHAAAAVGAAIRECGELLEQHFPAGSAGHNELPDAITVLPR